jgi:hypothetical protein
MADLTNLGFETAGTDPGDALAWSVSETITRELHVLWGSAVRSDVEWFETEWSTNEDYLFAFEGLLIDLTPAIFDSSLGSPNGAEDFEDGWSSNEGYSFDLGSSSTASFDTSPEDFEDYEEGWSSNQSYSFTLGSSTAASFDTAGTPEAFEDFEELWRSNEGYDFAMGSVDAALFVVQVVFGSPVTAAHENFESVFAEHLVTFTPATDLVNYTATPLDDDEIVTFRVVGLGGLPGGLSPETQYFVVSAATNSVKVSLTLAGTAVDITTVGTGAIYVARDTANYWIERVDEPIT